MSKHQEMIARIPARREKVMNENKREPSALEAKNKHLQAKVEKMEARLQAWKDETDTWMDNTEKLEALLTEIEATGPHNVFSVIVNHKKRNGGRWVQPYQEGERS